MEPLPAFRQMAPRRESFGPWTGKRESYSPTTPATLPRNFTIRTRRLPTEIISQRSAGISLRRWSQTAGSMSAPGPASPCLARSEEHTSELQSRFDLVCRLLLEKKKRIKYNHTLNIQQTTILQLITPMNPPSTPHYLTLCTPDTRSPALFNTCCDPTPTFIYHSL